MIANKRIEQKLVSCFLNRAVAWDWVVAGVTLFLFVCFIYFMPNTTGNEDVYLINSQKIVNPNFLAHDQLMGGFRYHRVLFDVLVGPFFYFFSPLQIALLGRVFVWSLLIWALTRLAKTLGLKWWEFVLIFSFWFYSGQALVAGEWVFGGFESKCLAYVFLFLSLRSILRSELIKSAILCGVSACFHILVGGWGAVGLFMVVLISEKEYRLKKMAIYCFFVFLCSLPALAPNLLDIWINGALTKEACRILVIFRGPHHLDPECFMTRKALELFVFYGFATFTIWKSFKWEHSLKLNVFLTSLMVIFVLGLLARKINMFSFLIFYPFRLGPLFLSLFFPLGAIHYLRVYFMRKGMLTRGICLSLSFILLFILLDKNMPRKFLGSPEGFLHAWKNYFLKRGKDDFGDMASWIKKNTARDSVFIGPPMNSKFYLFAERAQVVSFKYMPAAKIEEWYIRLVDLNGGFQFKSRGFEIHNELNKNYSILTLKQLQDIKTKYDTQYYLTPKEREDLPFLLAYFNKSYYLYDLRKLKK